MLSLESIAKYILNSGIDTGENITVGVIDENVTCCLGVFDNNKTLYARQTLGKGKNTRFYKQNISILVHWGNEQNKAKEKAFEIYDLFFDNTDYFIDDSHISFVKAYYPQSLGRTASGICDYVVSLEFYINKEE